MRVLLGQQAHCNIKEKVIESLKMKNVKQEEKMLFHAEYSHRK